MQRKQTYAVSNALNVAENEAPVGKPIGWDQARPYTDIPKVSLFYFLRHLMPGGKYHKMQYPDIMLDMRRQHGPLFRLPALGQDDILVTNDPHHFEQVLRVEGPWPERPGNNVLHHFRTVTRKEFYKGTAGMLST